MRIQDIRLIENFKERKKKVLEKISKRDFRKLTMKFTSMFERCYNPHSESHKKCYHDKGIRICQEWLDDKMSFVEWASENGYSEETNIIDRIDSNKNYSPDNCRFVDELKSLRNREICRTEKEQKAVRVLLENGFDLLWINKYFKTPLNKLKEQSSL